MREQTLGHYKLESQLGAGGMGVVYLATDTRLGRQVAIKLLHESSLKDPERRARFEREARVLASLNHPNIAAIHGLEAAGEVMFLVLEYVPGDTLSQRLAKAPLPLREALDLGRQVADALDAAHEAGVIHRDLKPANLKITPEGKAKVLDFGLAKALEAERPGAADGETETNLSRAGVVMGTGAIHESGAGLGQAGRPEDGYLGLRLRDVRGAEWKTDVPGRYGRKNTCGHPGPGTRVGCSAR
jgi:serine/threonine-protein kinase